MARRRTAFTLIELLAVITILLMLITILLPAVLRARLLVLAVLTKAQVAGLSNACAAYHTIFESFPGVVDDPPDSGGIPKKLSSCQSLRLSLLGCSRAGAGYSQEYGGPADDIDKYGDDLVRKRDPFYAPRPGELVAHNGVAIRDTSKDSDYGAIEVFVDYRLPPARPLLYYRARILGRMKKPNFTYEFDDNEVYCVGETKIQDGSYDYYGYFNVSTDELRDFLVNRQGYSVPASGFTAGGFVIISAGLDRRFFTDDDMVNFSR